MLAPIAGMLQSYWRRTHYTPARILVGLILPIGDTLFCRPILQGIRRAYPHAHITAMVMESTAPLVRVIPEIDDVIILQPSSAAKFMRNLPQKLSEIQQHHFDMVISFSAGGNLMALISGIPRQVWQQLPFFFWLWGARDQRYYHTHAIEHYWEVVRRLGIVPQGPEDHVPHWAISATEAGAARLRLQAVGVQADDQCPLVIIHPGAKGFYGSKQWPNKNFKDLANRIATHLHVQILVLGGAADIEAADAIVAATNGRSWSLAGQLSIPESIAMIGQAACYIGCDSGLTHFAVALHVPTVALFGITSLDQFAPRPIDPTQLRVLLPTPERKPIGFFIGTESVLFATHHYTDDKRMEDINVDRVWEAVQSLLPLPISQFKHQQAEVE